MIEYLIQFDRQLFHLINGDLCTHWLDGFMTAVRNKYVWAPLYLFFASYLILNYHKKGTMVLLAFLVTVVICDQASSSIIKPLFHRLRPCNDPLFKTQVRLLVTCGSGYSFISSHACNHFGMAMFSGLIFKRHSWVMVTALFWAGMISFAQVYVGVHYPFDVITGAGLGILCGWGTAFISKKLWIHLE